MLQSLTAESSRFINMLLNKIGIGLMADPKDITNVPRVLITGDEVRATLVSLARESLSGLVLVDESGANTQLTRFQGLATALSAAPFSGFQLHRTEVEQGQRILLR